MLNPFRVWARLKTYYMQGSVYFALFNTVVIMFIAVKSFYESLVIFNVPMPYVYFGAVVFGVFAPLIIGFLTII
jgi:hypothetical protein